MFYIDKEDKTIHITRGDAAAFKFYRRGKTTGETYNFTAGDVVRFTVFQKKVADNVVLQKDFAVTEETESVAIVLTKEETKIGGVINKPVDYWYEIEVNPFSNPKTYVAYDENGAKIFKLYPEGVRNADNDSITEEDIPVVDAELSLTSTRPVQNQAIARAITKIADDTGRQIQGLTDEMGSKVVTEIAKQFEDRSVQIKSIIDEATAQFEENVGEAVAEAIGNLGDEIYTKENKPTAEDVGAVPNTGGTYSGSVECITGEKKDIVARVGNSEHTGTLFASNWGCFGIWSEYRDDANGILPRYLIAADRDGNLFMNGSSASNGVTPYHTGNKPYGTYTGNGAVRTLNIGGNGNVLMISSKYGVVFVNRYCGVGMMHGLSEPTFTFASGQIRFIDGDLEIGYLSTLFNESGTDYTYQVL